jgi:hypothetical protein
MTTIPGEREGGIATGEGTGLKPRGRSGSVNE